MFEPKQDDRTLSAWPVCPECGKRRHTSCPVCGTSGNEFPLGDAGYPPLNSAEGEPEESRPLLICSTCDEPFEAAFLRLCEWCGHDFGEGVTRTEPAGGAAEPEPINPRVWLVAAGLGITLLAGLAYFLSIVE